MADALSRAPVRSPRDPARAPSRARPQRRGSAQTRDQLGADRAPFRRLVLCALEPLNCRVGHVHSEQVLVHPARGLCGPDRTDADDAPSLSVIPSSRSRPMYARTTSRSKPNCVCAKPAPASIFASSGPAFQFASGRRGRRPRRGRSAAAARPCGPTAAHFVAQITRARATAPIRGRTRASRRAGRRLLGRRPSG